MGFRVLIHFHHLQLITMKSVFVSACLLLTLMTSHAQVQQVYLQASGLTCSMCNNAINKSLQSIPFVERVTADIKNAAFQITFKKDAIVSFDELQSKVKDAGFAVAKFTLTLHVDSLTIAKDEHFTIDGRTFHFLNADGKMLSGTQVFKLVDKGFVTDREYKKNSKLTGMTCYATGVAGDCCSQSGLTKGTRIYHVTI